MKGFTIRGIIVSIVTVVVALFVINRVKFLRELVAPPPGA
jgi:hypothetical protein